MSDRTHHRSRSPALWVRPSNDTTTLLAILSVTLSLVALLVAIPPNSSPLRSGLIGTNASPPSSPVTTTIVFPPSPPPAPISFQDGGSSSPPTDGSQAWNSLVASLNAALARSDAHDLQQQAACLLEPRQLAANLLSELHAVRSTALSERELNVQRAEHTIRERETAAFGKEREMARRERDVWRECRLSGQGHGRWWDEWLMMTRRGVKMGRGELKKLVETVICPICPLPPNTCPAGWIRQDSMKVAADAVAVARELHRLETLLMSLY